MKKGKSGHAESVSKSEGTEKMQRDVKKEIAEGRKKENFTRVVCNPHASVED